MKRKTNLELHIGYSRMAAEEVNGDTAFSCCIDEGREYALILSDGMGHGQKAAQASKAAAERLRRNLKNGMAAAAALKEVNKYLIEQKGFEMREIFASLDLVIFDYGRQRINFYKMCAAPSFILRGKKVFRIEQPALPVGMVTGLKLARISVKLVEGDVVVVVSDGISQADTKHMSDAWLGKCLLQIASLEENMRPRRLAEYIMNEACGKYSTKERDDATVIVAIAKGI